MPQQKISFTGAGDERLAASLETPADAPRAYALFAHCFTCTKDIFSARYVAAGLAARGFAVLRFDFTGLGASEGDFANTNFSSNVGDLLAAAKFLREEYEAPRLLVGHSLGGAAVLAAAGDIPECRAVATIGAPSEPGHVAKLFTGHQDKIRADGEAEVLLSGRPFKIRKQFLEDIEGARLAEKIRNLQRALIVFHSATDKTVEIANARAIFEAARHPKTFVSLDGADHLLSNRRDAHYVADMLAQWSSRYLDLPPDEDAATSAKPAAGGEEDATVKVWEAGGSGLAQKIMNGKHEWIADEPATAGGGNTGPTPYGLLLSALGACTTMTIRLYARHKNLPLKQARVTLRHQKIHGRDCDECGDDPDARIDLIEREVEIIGDLSAAQRQSMLAIAEKCPVHRTLHNKIVVRTKLKDG